MGPTVRTPPHPHLLTAHSHLSVLPPSSLFPEWTKKNKVLCLPFLNDCFLMNTVGNIFLPISNLRYENINRIKLKQKALLHKDYLIKERKDIYKQDKTSDHSVIRRAGAPLGFRAITCSFLGRILYL